MVCLRHFAAPIPDGGADRAARRPSSGRLRRQYLSGKGQARAKQCGARREGRQDHRSAWRSGGDTRASAANSRPRYGEGLTHNCERANVMDWGIKGLRVVVTAGAAGIGREVARTFLREGALVHVCDVDRNALDELKTSDPKLKSSFCDVSDRKAVTAF